MSDTDLDALQTTLAAEHAAFYVYGSLGAATSQTATPVLFERVTQAYLAHRDRRDHLVALVLAAGGQPVGTDAAYDVPPLGSPASVQAAAVDLERACATTYAYLVASSTDRVRRWAATALAESAVSVLGFDGAAEPLPGLD